MPHADTENQLVFVDESGDHGLAAVNRNFPLFALAFCVFPKAAYADAVTPALRRLKLATFGQPNRAPAILESKLWRGPYGRVEGYGLELFPGKNEGPPGSPSGPSPNG